VELILQYLTIALLASVRLLMTPPVSFLAGFSLPETLITVNTGGIIGFLIFYFFSDWITWKNPNLQARRPGKRFSRLRRILKYRNCVGPWPFILTSPFLSVPVCAFIIRKLYRRSLKVFLFSLLTILFWGTLSCLLFSPVSLL
jgi:hypothetical protein